MISATEVVVDLIIAKTHNIKTILKLVNQALIAGAFSLIDGTYNFPRRKPQTPAYFLCVLCGR
jgi:hypothetical protein